MARHVVVQQLDGEPVPPEHLGLERDRLDFDQAPEGVADLVALGHLDAETLAVEPDGPVEVRDADAEVRETNVHFDPSPSPTPAGSCGATSFAINCR